MLTKKDVLRLLQQKELEFFPALDVYQLRDSGAIDVRLGSVVRVPLVPDWNDPSRQNEKIEELPQDGRPWIMAPHQSVLAQTSQRIKMPANVVAVLMSRTTAARRFLAVGQAGLVDRFYEGRLILPLTNLMNLPNSIRVGERIASLVFFKAEGDENSPFWSKYHKKDPSSAAALRETSEEEEAIRNGTWDKLEKI